MVSDQRSAVSGQRAVALALGVIALMLLLPVRLFEIANPEWRLLDWVHAMAVVALTLLLIWCAGGKLWLRHFTFPVVFIFIAVPWPTAVETPVIQGLMRTAARVAAETAMLLGIPAQVEGNLIRVTNGLIGVNEACSGIRSLQTSLMIGLLFGELKRLPVSRRIALVVGAVAIAILANFVRAVFLVVIAGTKDFSEVTRWHDIAGYAIIALVFVGTMALAYLLGRNRTVVAGVLATPKLSEGGSPANIRESQPAPVRLRSGQALPLQILAFSLIAAVCWLLFVEVGTASWYRVHERNLVNGMRWTVKWPQQAPKFRNLKIDEEIRSVLRFDEGHAAAWNVTSQTAAGSSDSILCHLYLFRWEPGKNSALLANLHRPDVCLPASGWTQIADDGVRNYAAKDEIELPFRHFEFQRRFGNAPPQTAHAFYCLSEDRAVNNSEARPAMLARPSLGEGGPSMSGTRSEWTRAERLRAVLEGRRHLGQQVMEAIFFTSKPFSSTDAESHLRDLVRDVVVLREPARANDL